MNLSPLQLPAPALAIGLLSLASALVLTLGRVPSPRTARTFLLAGSLCLALAAIDLRLPWQRTPNIVVMLDLSASTRTAGYRDRAALRFRLHQLLGDRPFRIVGFADGQSEITLNGNEPIADRPSARTRFVPPSADTIVLLSDGRFALPDAGQALPPIYPVVDAGLSDVADGAIENMYLRSEQAAVDVSVVGPSRVLHLQGTRDESPVTVSGHVTIIRPIDPAAHRISAQLSPGDAWAENDAMSIVVAPAPRSQRWWVGETPGRLSGDWKIIDPANLPTESSEYLAPRVIVLHDLDSAALSPIAQDRLMQYVGNLGGSVLILGGSHAFGAGGYEGSVLGVLSPLASAPPGPHHRWVLLVDASGSMNAPSDGQSRWASATAALVALLPGLPPDDPVAIGQFSDSVRWWSRERAASDAARQSLPPADASARGPTNLEPALMSVAQQEAQPMQTQLIVLTDADAEIAHPQALLGAFNEKMIHLDVLALGEGSGLPALRTLVEATGGQMLSATSAAQWTDQAKALLQRAWPEAVGHGQTTATFTDDFARFGSQPTLLWDRVWVKSRATALATSDDGTPLAARWNVGLGLVAAIAFDPANAQAMADAIAQRPADPRLALTWQYGRQIGLRVDAKNATHYLNDLPLSFQCIDPQTSTILTHQAIAQTGPGEYAIAIDAPDRPTIGQLLLNGQLVDQAAFADRYPAEFDAVGTDLRHLESLAQRSGGAVIAPNQTTPIAIRWADDRVALMPWLAGLAALLWAMSLLRWRAFTRGVASV